jgi:hypothetical protein
MATALRSRFNRGLTAFSAVATLLLAGEGVLLLVEVFNGLEVAMVNVPAVRGGESPTNLYAIIGRFAKGKGSTSQTRSKRLSFEQLRHDVRSPAGFARIENRENVGMVQARGGASLEFEPVKAFRVTRKTGGEYFDRDHAPEP